MRQSGNDLSHNRNGVANHLDVGGFRRAACPNNDDRLQCCHEQLKWFQGQDFLRLLSVSPSSFGRTQCPFRTGHAQNIKRYVFSSGGTTDDPVDGGSDGMTLFLDHFNNDMNQPSYKDEANFGYLAGGIVSFLLTSVSVSRYGRNQC